MNKVVVLTLILSVILVSAPTAVENTYLDLLRSDVRTQKRVLVDQHMGLNEEESKAFWPVYEDYEYDLKKLNNQRLELIREYSKNWYGMTDTKAREIAKTSLSLNIKEAHLRQDYYRKFEYALSSKRAAQFLQLEYMIDLLVDVQIASELPLIQ